MQGGYLADRFNQGKNSDECYSIYHWAYIDIFVYFSHELLTIPPKVWVDQAHRNNTKVLGTFITEWDDGAATCAELLSSPESWQHVAVQMAKIAKDHGFEGWLVNIENKIALEHVKFLELFVDALRKACLQEASLYSKRTYSPMLSLNMYTRSGHTLRSFGTTA
jgi:mannosyl-glycoprotein endo-beta-N-acetylglucosaminidase